MCYFVYDYRVTQIKIHAEDSFFGIACRQIDTPAATLIKNGSIRCISCKWLSNRDNDRYLPRRSCVRVTYHLSAATLYPRRNPKLVEVFQTMEAQRTLLRAAARIADQGLASVSLQVKTEQMPNVAESAFESLYNHIKEITDGEELSVTLALLRELLTDEPELRAIVDEHARRHQDQVHQDQYWASAYATFMEGASSPPPSPPGGPDSPKTQSPQKGGPAAVREGRSLFSSKAKLQRQQQAEEAVRSGGCVSANAKAVNIASASASGSSGSAAPLIDSIELGSMRTGQSELLPARSNWQLLRDVWKDSTGRPATNHQLEASTPAPAPSHWQHLRDLWRNPRIEQPPSESSPHNIQFHQDISPRLGSPRLDSPRLASPRLASPRLESPRLDSPHLDSPHVASSPSASPAASPAASGSIASTAVQPLPPPPPPRADPSPPPPPPPPPHIQEGMKYLGSLSEPSLVKNVAEVLLPRLKGRVEAAFADAKATVDDAEPPARRAAAALAAAQATESSARQDASVAKRAFENAEAEQRRVKTAQADNAKEVRRLEEEINKPDALIAQLQRQLVEAKEATIRLSSQVQPANSKVQQCRSAANHAAAALTSAIDVVKRKAADEKPLSQLLRTATEALSVAAARRKTVVDIWCATPKVLWTHLAKLLHVRQCKLAAEAVTCVSFLIGVSSFIVCALTREELDAAATEKKKAFDKWVGDDAAGRDPNDHLLSLLDSFLPSGVRCILAPKALVPRPLIQNQNPHLKPIQCVAIEHGKPFLPRKQDLPAQAFLSKDDAMALYSVGNRSVKALSYGWRMAGNPDPDGETLEAVRRHLDAEKEQEEQAARLAETLGQRDSRKKRKSTLGIESLPKGLFWE